MNKLTTQRQNILDLINTSNRHWDADEVAQALKERGCAIGLATIYRGLAFLADAGLIECVQLGDKKRYERADKAHHDHMVCTACGRIEEFAHATIEALQEAAARERGFRISGHQLVIYGRCRDCAGGEA